MSHKVHVNARTTPKTRSEIRQSTLTVRELMACYSIGKGTVLKWRRREDVNDRSHRPHKLRTTLSAAEELVVLELRRLLWLPLDDLLVVTRQFINPKVSRAGINRLLIREGLGDLKAMRKAAREGAGENTAPVKKQFKDYEPGFVHVDIKYLPRMSDEDERRYLFVAIDRATRWVFMKIYADQSQASAEHFLRALYDECPVKIIKLLTDNGTQFTDRFTNKEKTPSGNHVFDQLCVSLGIDHRLSPPRHPQTNGMVERFNRRISEVCDQTRFANAAELEQTLMHYLLTYNYHIPQKSLGHISPHEAMMQWQTKRPEMFRKSVINQPKPNS